jgi:cytidyltransferase-like protein
LELEPFIAKKFLTTIISIQIEKGRSTIDTITKRLDLPLIESRIVLSNLSKMGLIERKASVISVTKLGRGKIKVVMAGGVFDIVHVGHIATLWAARKLGDMLVVIVARDCYVRKTKGKDPINDESLRLNVVRNLKPVDAAILGDKKDIYKIVEKIKPDVIALGYDQKHKVNEMSKELLRRRLQTKVIRLKIRVPGVKTSNILSHVNRSFAGKHP